MKQGVTFKAARVAIVLSTAVAVAVGLVILRPKAERRDPPPAGMLVEVMPAVARDVVMTVEGYGTVRPRRLLKLVAEVPGQVVAVDPVFEAGNPVPAGTVLARIDPRAFSLEVDRRRALAAQADAERQRLEQERRNLEATRRLAVSDLDLTRADFERIKTLSGRQVVDSSTRDKAEQRYLASRERLQSLDNGLALIEPALAQVRAQEETAAAALGQVRLDLEHTRLTAPFDAWVLEKTVEEGQHASVGQSLGSIYRQNALDVEVQVPVDELKWLAENLESDPKPEAEVFFQAATPPLKWTGRVTRILARMEEKTRTLPLVVEIDDSRPNDSGEGRLRLRPGMFVTVRLKGRMLRKVYVLPRHLLREGDRVYVANDHRLSLRPVTVLRQAKDQIYVSDGLSDGDLLVKSPLAGAAEGLSVRFTR